jgi:Skp family chaperone for outer membrane proteins
MLITLLSIIVLGSLLLVFGWFKATKPRDEYAYVDPQPLAAALQQTAEFQKLLRATEEEYAQFTVHLQAKTEKEVEDLKREKTAQQKGKNAAEQRALEDEFGTKLRKLYETKQVELDAKKAMLQDRLDQAIRARIMEVAAQVAQAEGITYVFSGQVVYSGGRDLTEQVLTILENSGEERHE